MRHAILVCLLLMPLSQAAAQGQPSKDGVPVEIVATASEYIPLSTTVSHPGHAYTNCLGSTFYFGDFAADTSTSCKTTFTPPTETTFLVKHKRVNYTIVKTDKALYLLSCTQTWKPTALARIGIALASIGGAGPGGDSGAVEKATGSSKGRWSECPAFSIGTKYTLTVNNTSDARLESTAGGESAAGNPVKLEYLASAALPATKPQAAAPPQAQAVVHVTSSPSGGEIYVDGKFFGNTPSDITLASGQHIVKVTMRGKEWSRSIEITPGEVSVHADIAEK